MTSILHQYQAHTALYWLSIEIMNHIMLNKSRTAKFFLNYSDRWHGSWKCSQSKEISNFLSFDLAAKILVWVHSCMYKYKSSQYCKVLCTPLCTIFCPVDCCTVTIQDQSQSSWSNPGGHSSLHASKLFHHILKYLDTFSYLFSYLFTSKLYTYNKHSGFL